MHGIYGPKRTELSRVDVVIVGAGPAGLACAVELSFRGIASLIFDKGQVVNSLSHFPTHMRFFTSGTGLEIGGLPLDSLDERPGRTEVLNYYRRVAQHYDLSIRQEEEVRWIDGHDESFIVRTAQSAYACRKVIIATGYYDKPNLAGIPGEDAEKVSHYYKEPYGFSGQDVAVIGGRNSAGTAALELFRAGAHVTLIYRGPAFTNAMKHWIREDIQARIQNSEISALFSSHLRAIYPRSIIVETPRGTATLRNHFVFALTGYKPDMEFLKGAGISLDGAGKRPLLNPESLETSRSGVYLAGVVAAGLHTNELNIEHAKDHAKRIASSVARSRLDTEYCTQTAVAE